ERRRLHLGQLDADLAAEPATRRDRSNAVDALEPRRDGAFGQFAQRHRIELAFDREAHDRERRRVELEDDRRVGIFGQPGPDAVDAAADVLGGLTEVGAPDEVQPHRAAALGRTRVHLVETGHGADRLFDWPRDAFLDLARADA